MSEFGNREWHGKDAAEKGDPDHTIMVKPRRRETDVEGWSDAAAVWDDGGFATQGTERRAGDDDAAGAAKRERRSGYSNWQRRREQAREGGWGARGDMLRRLRQPVIGLTLAGAAAPLAHAIRSHQETAQQPREASATNEPLAAAGELEEVVGEKWLEAQRAAAGTTGQQAEVEKAVERYGIASDLAQDIIAAAEKNGIEAKMALGLVKTESTFNQRAVSHVGARGLTQVMPRTARWLRPGTTAEDLFERKLNLDLGFSYLRDLIDKYNGNEKLALLAYNRGPGTVDKILKRGGNPDNGYAAKVLKG